MTHADKPSARSPRPHRRLPLLLATAGILAAVCTTAQAEERKNALVLTIDGYVDGGTDASRRKIGVLEQEDRETDTSRGLSFALSLGYLRDVAPHMRAGGTFRYLGTYEFEPDADGGNADELQLGRLMEATGRFEYAIDLAKKIDVILGLETGLAMLLPGGELNAELETLEDQGFSIWNVPRIGVLGGAEIAGAYELSPWLSARLGLGLVYSKLFLYDATADDDRAEVSRSFSLVRVRAGLGLEARF